LPLVFADQSDYKLLAQGDRLELADAGALLRVGGSAFMKNPDTGQAIAVRCELGGRERATIVAGGSLAQARYSGVSPERTA